MIFAASFFGAFEITLPESIVNKSDKNSDKKGLAGVFFMALTLVLVSFSCTGPIVGSVLIKSTQGEFWEPMVTMLAFSVAFALPFTVLAFFPSLLKKFKKSGGSWLNSVKVVLGFVEVALGPGEIVPPLNKPTHEKVFGLAKVIAFVCIAPIERPAIARCSLSAIVR